MERWYRNKTIPNVQYPIPFIGMATPGTFTFSALEKLVGLRLVQKRPHPAGSLRLTVASSSPPPSLENAHRCKTKRRRSSCLPDNLLTRDKRTSSPPPLNPTNRTHPVPWWCASNDSDDGGPFHMSPDARRDDKQNIGGLDGRNGGFEKSYACALLKIEFRNDVMFDQSLIHLLQLFFASGWWWFWVLTAFECDVKRPFFKKVKGNYFSYYTVDGAVDTIAT